MFITYTLYMKKHLLLVLALVTACTHFTFSQTGQLDPSFGNDGRVWPSFLSSAKSMVVQPDGKSVIAGDKGLVRLNTDGSPDNTFGSSGNVSEAFQLVDVALQADGKIVAVGNTNDKDIALVRFNSNGTRDVSFGANGIQLLGYSSANPATAYAMLIQASGRIVIDLQLNAVFRDKNLLRRFNTNGSPDNSFGNGGSVETGLLLDYVFKNVMIQQPDGKIVAIGKVTSPGTYITKFGVVRLSQDGIPDATFGTGGAQVYDLGDEVTIFAVAIQPDGKLVFTGEYFYPSEQSDIIFVRLNANGTLDNSFSGDGILLLNINNYSYSQGMYALAIQDNGKIIAGGITDYLQYSGLISIIRLNPDGSLDQLFATDGIQKTETGFINLVSSLSIFNNKLYATAGTNGTDGAFVSRYILDGFDVSISSPVNTAKITGPANITLTASVSSFTSPINNVKFYSGATLLNTDNTAPYAFTWPNVTLGQYTVTAVATNNNGEVATSQPVIFTIEPDMPPVVSITSPAANSVIPQTASLNVSATAVDGNSDGTITKVEFFAGSASLGSSTTLPFSVNWANPPAGGYTLTAKATSNTGQTTTSSGVPITIASGVPPTVSITSPANNTSFRPPTTITITADAQDPNNGQHITKVEFYANNGQLLGTDNTSPFNYDLAVNYQGSFDITAKAFSSNGLSATSSPVHLTITSPYLPAVVITTPTNTQRFPAPATFEVNADAYATYPGAKIDRVEFYLGATLIETQYNAPYKFKIQNLPIGNYSLTAEAYDNTGAKQQSANVVILVQQNQLPTVQLTGLAQGQRIPVGSGLKLTAIASDPDGKVKSVEFLANNILLFTEVNAPYTRKWLANLPLGNYNLTARVTDNTGGVVTSAPVAVSIETNQPPTVTITSPYQDQHYPGPALVRLIAEANDPVGKIIKVEFYNGSNLITTEYNYPYDYQWNNVSIGNYNIIAKAYDNSGAVTTSQAVSMSVLPNHSPLVTLTSPQNNGNSGSSSNIQFEALASDPDGSIKRVEFYNGATLLFTEYQYPYSRTLYSLAQGTYNFTAKAFDNNGASATSPVVHYTVGTPPTLFSGIMSPNEMSLNPFALSFAPNPASRVLNVKLDNVGNGQRVRFYIYNTIGALVKIATTSSSSTQLNISSLAKGAYVLKAVAGDKVISKPFIKE